MNSIPCSKRSIAILVLAVAVVGAAGTAAAVSVSEDDVPREVKVETGTSATVTLEELYTGAPSEWTLRAETNLTGDRTWQISKKKFGGAGITNESGSGASIETAVSQSDDHEEITLTVSGTMPNRTEYAYDPQQNLSAITLYRVTDSGETKIGTIDVAYFTENSQAAREEIDQAKQAIEQAGGDKDAENSLQSAISFYNNGQFADATREANNAQDKATQAKQSQQTTQLLIYGGVGIVVLALVGGGVWYWRNQQDDYDKLR